MYVNEWPDGHFQPHKSNLSLFLPCGFSCECECANITKGPEDQDYSRDGNDNYKHDPHYLPNGRKRQALKNSLPIQKLDAYLSVKPRDVNAKNWLWRPEIPTAREIMDLDEDWEKEKNANGITMAGIPFKGPFVSASDENSAKFAYLETHYQFLREDAVRPLREAIVKIRDSRKIPVECLERGWQSIGIYSKVHVRGLTFSRRGIAVEISFSLRSCRSKVVWGVSNRLTSGCLVALSRDQFRSHCIVATIAARNRDKLDLNPPRIDLFFADSNDLELDPCEEFMMVEERSGFFEAQRSSMLALQRMMKENDEECFPLSKKIIQAEEDKKLPAYVAKNPVVNAINVFGQGFEEYNVTSMPNPRNSTMDETQLSALHHMINAQLAVVQGPPGTGKTYVSVLALKLLLALTEHDDSPIVVACHTNHALDQLLRHVAVEIPNEFARLGNQSKDDGIIKQRTMKTLRQGLDSAEKDPCSRSAKTRKQHELATRHLKEALGLYTTGNVTLKDFEVAGILSPEQCQSIISGNSQYAGESRRAGNRRQVARAAVIDESEKVDPLHRWLGSELETAPDLDHDDTLELDLPDDEQSWELEVAQERRVEAGTGDDELDEVQGEYFPLRMNWRGRSRTILSEADAQRLLSNNNINDVVPLRQRGVLFNCLLSKMKKGVSDKFKGLANREYNHLPAIYQQRAFERDLVILKGQKLIGMTTTGLSKFRPLVDALVPKVIMIEEAAEALEAPLVTACVPSLQHLILVGDHQQLRPSIVVKEHAGGHWNFDLSLMERLLNNGMAYQTLGVQRRMAPKISANLDPIYGDKIRDHEDVKDRIPIDGMMDTAWAYSHKHFDNKDMHMSSYNEAEADMIAGFYLYLLQNGTGRKRITVLTFYKAQQWLLLRKLQEICYKQKLLSERPAAFHPDDHLPDVRTVDSYQGEENDVIILSLVRSCGSTSIGFGGSDNRICVAISRARLGFYIFGNMDLFSSCSPTWSRITQIMRSKAMVGEEDMRIKCRNHGNVSIVSSAQDWNEINGGCLEPCETMLACGHKCPALCHP